MFNKLKQMNLGSILGLLVILVVFPLGALYYMNMGAKWRMERLSELKDYSRLSEQQVRAAYDTLAGIFEDKNNIIIAGFINPANEELTALYGENLRKLHEQFDARGDVFFVMHTGAEASFVASFREKYALEDTAQCRFVIDDGEKLANLAREVYQIERAEGEDGGAGPYFALVGGMVVRNYYDIRRTEAVQRLVEHIAILIPPAKEREDLVFKRETEK